MRRLVRPWEELTSRPHLLPSEDLDVGPGGSALWHRGSRARGCWSAPRGLVCTGAGLSSRSRSPTSARKAPSGLTRLDHREGLAYSMVLGSEKGEMRTLFCAVRTSRPHVSRCTPQLTHNTHIRKDAAVTSENNLTPERCVHFGSQD